MNDRQRLGFFFCISLVRSQFLAGFFVGIFTCGFFLNLNAPFVFRYPPRYFLQQPEEQQNFLMNVEARLQDKFNARLNVQYAGKVKDVKPWDITSEVYLWDWYPPIAPCLYRERIGILGDGGKWICDLARYSNPRASTCIIYSFGVRGDSSFEAEMHERTACDIYGFDFSVTSMAGAAAGMERVHFQRVGLGAKETSQLLTLKQIMEQHKHSFIDVLKVDIEGAEFEVLATLAKEFNSGSLPIEQLLLEIHHEKGLTAQFFEIMRSLRSHGLVPFSHETNYNPPARGLPADVIEMSFYNVNTWWRTVKK